MKMLIVDDSAMTRKVLRSQLLHLGYSEVFEARDGGEALFKLQDKEPDLVFLDIHMPDMDGRSFMKNLQSRAELTNTTVICVSADTSSEQSKAMLELGVRCYLTKPFAPEQLRMAIKIAMGCKGERTDPVEEPERRETCSSPRL